MLKDASERPRARIKAAARIGCGVATVAAIIIVIVVVLRRDSKSDSPSPSPATTSQRIVTSRCGTTRDIADQYCSDDCTGMTCPGPDEICWDGLTPCTFALTTDTAPAGTTDPSGQPTTSGSSPADGTGTDGPLPPGSNPSALPPGSNPSVLPPGSNPSAASPTTGFTPEEIANMAPPTQDEIATQSLAESYPWLEITSNAQLLSVAGPTINFTVLPPNIGSRVTGTWKSTSAVFCADVLMPAGTNLGTVFAMYAISQEPVDREIEKWWELDFEFMGKDDTGVWVNYFQAGIPSPELEGKNMMPLPAPHNSGYHRYCIDWDVPTLKATWTVDGKLFYQADLDSTWAAPLYIVFSYWVGIGEWTGAEVITAPLTASVKDITYTDRAAGGTTTPAPTPATTTPAPAPATTTPAPTPATTTPAPTPTTTTPAPTPATTTPAPAPATTTPAPTPATTTPAPTPATTTPAPTPTTTTPAPTPTTTTPAPTTSTTSTAPANRR